LCLPPWPQPIIENGSSIQGRSQDGANIEEFKYLSKENISCTYLIHRLFDRGRATSKHGGGGRYDAIFGVQRGVFFKKREREEKESSKAMYGASKVKVSQEKNE
jgi:hypothetical protein